MKSDWVICIDEGACTYIVEGRKYLVEWNGNYAKILEVENSPFHLARGRTYKRERFKLVSTMNKETIPQILNYLLVDEYGEIHTFKNVNNLETYMEDLDELEVENTQILFVYENGNVTQRFLSDVVDFHPSIKPQFK